MEAPKTIWKYWCQLCAKDDPNNLNSATISIRLPVDIKLEEFKDIMAKILSIQEKDLPVKCLCTECHSFLVFLIRYSERVARVQQMFEFLNESPIRELYDLASVRLKFNVSEENSYRLQQHVKPENLTSAPSCWENDDKSEVTVKVELNGPEEVIYDEECLAKEIQEDEDSFEYAEDPFHSESTLDQDIKTKVVKRCINKRKRRTREEMKRQASEATKRKSEESSGKDFPLEVSCVECNVNFNLYSTYYKHLKVQHASAVNENRWKCPSCESTLHTRDSFRRHMMLHVPADHLPIQCTQCDNRYLTNSQLKLHLQQRHSNEKPFICEECGFGSTTLGNLKQHIITHSDQMPYKCEMCKKSFKSMTQLKRHLDTHGTSKYVCTICSQELKSRTTLKRHYLVHSDDMHHKCDYCGRAFKRSKTLKTHLLLHTGLKPYSCDFCERTFANGSNCRSHMKKMHPVELSALEASGGRAHTQNIPKLENLKALTK